MRCWLLFFCSVIFTSFIKLWSVLFYIHTGFSSIFSRIVVISSLFTLNFSINLWTCMNSLTNDNFYWLLWFITVLTPCYLWEYVTITLIFYHVIETISRKSKNICTWMKYWVIKVMIHKCIVYNFIICLVLNMLLSVSSK